MTDKPKRPWGGRKPLPVNERTHRLVLFLSLDELHDLYEAVKLPERSQEVITRLIDKIVEEAEKG
jgi:hypothetical protein